MSLKIVLDTTLENKPEPTFLSLNIQSELDLQKPDMYYSQFEYTDRLIQRQNNDYRTNNNFVNAFIDSYNLHKPLKLRPDDIKLQILSIISTCVNNNPESFRSYFVEHEGKKELVVKSTVFSADYFCQKFAELLEENIKDKEFATHYTNKFSTTNQIISTVNNITLMNTLKEYFSYSLMLCCGIPSVILEGTPLDWTQLEQTYQFFKRIFGETELKNWFRHFDKIMELFMKMRNLQETGIYDADNYIKEMWKRVISYVPQGSGDDTILGGWIRLFVPYSRKNKIIGGLDTDIACLDLTKPEPSNNRNYYKWQDEMKEFYIASDWDNMTSSFATTPAILIDYDETEYKVEFYSGFYEPHLTDTDEVCMNIGYMMREDHEVKTDKLKKHYLKIGVKNTDKNSLSIPKHLKKVADRILKTFGAIMYNFYGVDPEEEARKQYFIDNGVQKVKANYSNKLLVPNKFKDNSEEITEMKNLFETYKIEFID
jgi:hypothetical protein